MLLEDHDHFSSDLEEKKEGGKEVRVEKEEKEQENTH